TLSRQRERVRVRGVEQQSRFLHRIAPHPQPLYVSIRSEFPGATYFFTVITYRRQALLTEDWGGVVKMNDDKGFGK
ncbi:MAG: hypothetical protein NUV63_08880, partial [Gallionella sp.]|nr:hypothetical protein [Gallionella sp.]